MKTLLILSIMLSSSAVFAFTCNRTVNQNNVVVFVDMRDSRAEVESAARAACNRGEVFRHMSGNNLSADYIKSQFNAIARENKAITSLVVSGHDGGGSIHGNGVNNLDKDDIITGMKAAYRGKPALLSKFNSLYLWGCWTNGPGEVAALRTGLPSLKMISGFIDMAPLNTTEATHTILGGLLERERSFTSETDRNRLRRGLAAIDNINQTYAAVYVEACGENLYYYNKNSSAEEHGVYDAHNSVAPDPNFSPGTHFVNFDNAFSCARPPADLEQKRALIMDYYLGRRPIPADTAHGPLRALYSYARNNSRCLGKMPQFNGDRLLMLTFFENVKKNFALKWAQDISNANTEYSRLMREMRNTGTNQWDLPIMSGLKNYMEAGHSKVFLPNERTLAGKSRLQIRQMIAHLDGIQKHPAMRIPGVRNRFQNLKRLQQKMETYLFQLNPNCMDFMSWHEHTPGVYPSASCE